MLLISSSALWRSVIQVYFTLQSRSAKQPSCQISTMQGCEAANSNQANLSRLQLPERCRSNLAEYSPAIHPKYFVVFEPMTCLAPSKYPSVTNRAAAAISDNLYTAGTEYFQLRTFFSC